MADFYGIYEQQMHSKISHLIQIKCGVCYPRNKHVQLYHTERYQTLPFEILFNTIHCLNDSLTISVRPVDILKKKNPC